jgi:hypothetical protein
VIGVSNVRILSLLIGLLLCSVAANAVDNGKQSQPVGKSNAITVWKSQSPADAALSPAVEQLQSQLAQLQDKLKAVKERESLTALAEGQKDLKKQLDAIHDYLAYLGVGLGLFGALMMALVAFLVLNASLKAKAESKEVTEKMLQMHEIAVQAKLVEIQEILAEIQRRNELTMNDINTDM